MNNNIVLNIAQTLSSGNAHVRTESERESQNLLEIAKELERTEPLNVNKLLASINSKNGVVVNGNLYNKSKEGLRRAMQDFLKSQTEKRFSHSAMSTARALNQKG